MSALLNYPGSKWGMAEESEHIARISYGKDSLKMLNVIWTRGLPLHRITTTDVWATDSVPAWLPPMQIFKDRMDQWIWDHYHIEVEHLCAMNKDGTKKTYEQMFYHVPQRRSQTVQVERHSCAGINQRIPSAQCPMVSILSQAERSLPSTGNDYRIPSKHRIQLLSETQSCPGHISKDSRFQRESHGARNSRPECRPQGFPAQISSWCKKLKIDYVRTPLFGGAPHKVQGQKYCGISRHCSG